VFAGRSYLDPLREREAFATAPAPVRFPLQEADCAGIGEQMQWLDERVAAYGEQGRLVTDGGDTGKKCTDKTCMGEATYALWMGEQFSRVADAHPSYSYDDGDLHPHVCEDCLPRYRDLHGDKGEFVSPEEKLVTDGGTSSGGSDGWACPECGEVHSDIDAKCPGGCLDCVELIRYIEYEAPGMGMVENDVTAVECLNRDCDASVKVDPYTLYPEDDDAVDLESKEMDMETGELTGYSQVEIFCSPECRNQRYVNSDTDRSNTSMEGSE
jgi:predicted  nucleic acid-binding Zn-ribbon protein